MLKTVSEQIVSAAYCYFDLTIYRIMMSITSGVAALQEPVGGTFDCIGGSAGRGMQNSSREAQIRRKRMPLREAVAKTLCQG
jgi:hypothetical protein